MLQSRFSPTKMTTTQLNMKSTSLSRFFRLTLTVVMLLAASFGVSADVRDLPTKEINGRLYYYYQVKPKDTFFSLTRSLGVSRSDIEKYNPAAVDGLKAYATLYFPVDTFSGADAPAPAPAAASDNTPVTQPEPTAPVREKSEPVPSTLQTEGTLYKIQKGQSLYGIAYANNISVDELIAANPGIDPKSYKAGTVIVIPSHETEEIEIEVKAGDTGDDDDDDEDVADDDDDTADDEDDADASGDDIAGGDDLLVGEREVIPSDTLRIAVMLPLEIEKAEPSRAGRLYTEFYRGFLLGADNMSRSGQSVEITLYDSSDSTAFESVLSRRPEMEKFNLFIGPETSWGIRSVAAKAQSDSAWIINPFAVKDAQQTTVPRLLQANIPHNEMYDGAIDRFMEQFKDCVPVFVGRVDGTADKAPFTEQLKATLDKAGKEYKVIAFHSVLTSEELQDLRADTTTVFIPMSSSRNEFAKFSPALRDFRNQSLSQGGQVAIFGYPEWITFRGEFADQLGELNATIYSRFYSPTGDYLARHVATDYARWFGEDMTDAIPNQALLGFDVAMYTINSLRENGGALIVPDPDGEDIIYDGLQSSFRPQLEPGDKGWTNHALYFITFGEGGRTQHEIVTVPNKPATPVKK